MLPIDGGGVKGALVARLVERIEDNNPGTLAAVECFPGTSIGGVLALYYALGLPPKGAVEIFENHAASIFAKRDIYDTISGGLDRYARADFGQEGLRTALEEVFKDKRIKDLQKRVLIPSFDMATFRPKFFDRENDGARFLVDVGLATSAAPTYFPAHVTRHPVTGAVEAFIDGGVVANNPAGFALAYARRLDFNTATMLSIGTGEVPYDPPEELSEDPLPKTLDWGYRKWLIKGQRLTKVMFEGHVKTSHFVAGSVLGQNYFRVQPELPEVVDLADADKVPLLLEVADSYDLAPALDWVRMHWSKGVRS